LQEHDVDYNVEEKDTEEHLEYVKDMNKKRKDHQTNEKAQFEDALEVAVPLPPLRELSLPAPTTLLLRQSSSQLRLPIKAQQKGGCSGCHESSYEPLGGRHEPKSSSSSSSCQ
jgi:hypothetical protein